MGLGKRIDKGLDILDKVVPDLQKKQEIAHQIINRELESDNPWVKMARPSIIYFGLVVILLEILGVRFLILNAIDASDTIIKASSAMLEYFLFTWGGITGLYIGGRSYEKAKMKSFRK